MNTPVSFPIAKLLKEKGFDEVSQKWYSVEGGCYFIDEFNNNRGFVPAFECEAPTIAEVVMWLYEKHGIWISIVHQNDKFFWRFGSHQTQEFSSPTEAYEAAILYTLNNLL